MAKSDQELFNELKEAKSSAEVTVLIPKFRQAEMSSQLNVDKLESSLEEAIFESPEVRKKLHDQIASAKGILDDFGRGLRVAERRLKDFKEQEFETDIKKHSIEALETNRRLGTVYAKIHDSSLQLSDLLVQAKELKKVLHSKNALFAAHKKPELKVTPILSVLARHLQVTTDMIGTQGSHFVHDPVEEFVLPEYYPQKPNKWQPRLAHLKDIEV